MLQIVKDTHHLGELGLGVEYYSVVKSVSEVILGVVVMILKVNTVKNRLRDVIVDFLGVLGG